MLSARRWVSVGKPEELYFQSSRVVAASASCAHARVAALMSAMGRAVALGRALALLTMPAHKPPDVD